MLSKDDLLNGLSISYNRIGLGNVLGIDVLMQLLERGWNSLLSCTQASAIPHGPAAVNTAKYAAKTCLRFELDEIFPNG